MRVFFKARSLLWNSSLIYYTMVINANPENRLTNCQGAYLDQSVNLLWIKVGIMCKKSQPFWGWLLKVLTAMKMEFFDSTPAWFTWAIVLSLKFTRTRIQKGPSHRIFFFHREILFMDRRFCDKILKNLHPKFCLIMLNFEHFPYHRFFFRCCWVNLPCCGKSFWLQNFRVG